LSNKKRKGFVPLYQVKVTTKEQKKKIRLAIFNLSARKMTIARRLGRHYALQHPSVIGRILGDLKIVIHRLRPKVESITSNQRHRLLRGDTSYLEMSS